MSAKTRVDQVRMITRTKLHLNDYQWNIGDMLEDNLNGFDLEVTETRIMSYNNYF